MIQSLENGDVYVLLEFSLDQASLHTGSNPCRGSAPAKLFEIFSILDSKQPIASCRLF